ncbi:immunoglobulin domain-containing family protein [Tessaracoccus caeni]|uniref:hypothetical protein n=1 Tax=Tessaracoccus caeni TaxID=3031239 RepID=UPI0023DB9EA5|nr:hypothetical protein [Tessaracoccus caeni]MDF1487424.1 hypothetical protein [Tessaracoccus caeni]
MSSPHPLARTIRLWTAALIAAGLLLQPSFAAADDTTAPDATPPVASAEPASEESASPETPEPAAEPESQPSRTQADAADQPTANPDPARTATPKPASEKSANGRFSATDTEKSAIGRFSEGGETETTASADAPADAAKPADETEATVAPLADGDFVTGTTTTYTHFGGETVVYNAEVEPGQPIRLSGTGWTAKPERTVEGERGSVIGVKLIDDDLGQLQRKTVLANPRPGVPNTNDTVWGAVWADNDGSFELELEWPSAANAVKVPAWKPGSSFTVQLLSGTMYSDQAGVDPNERPDVSRTVPLTITIAGAAPVDPTDPTDPEEPTKGQVAITTHPQSASVEAGENVTFTAAAKGSPTPTVRWQRSLDGGETWTDLRGATSTSYTMERVFLAQSSQRYRAVFTNSASPKGVATQEATLIVTPRGTVQTTCGASYGPGTAHTGVEFCFKGPEKVVAGQDIVIEGVGGYLATDGKTGSVINFLLDAQYSGDPNTVYSTRTLRNPATGKALSDTRSHAVVQARPDGTWTATIPWPTPTGTTLTKTEIAQRFAPGTEHSIRMLTGSLLTDPADRQRGGSLFFTVVKSLSDDVSLKEPVYEHHTFRSTVAKDRAVAWLPTQVESKSAFPLTGTGWLTKDKSWGSTINVRLLDAKGKAYTRPKAERPVSSDSTVWQVIRANELGEIATTIAMPSGLTGGDHLAVQLTTTDDGTALGDVARTWTSSPLIIDNIPYVPKVSDGATCKAKSTDYSFQLAPGMKRPAANVGGSIRLKGEDWCNLVGGGSLIAIKINAGGYQHLPTATAAHYDANRGKEVGTSPAGISKTNKTIWYVIEADEHGSFDVDIPLPTRTNSKPGFAEGSYTLQLLTRTLSADPYYAGSRPDPSRSVVTPEFTVVAEGASLDNVKPGKPAAAPDPLHTKDDLKKSRKGGVEVSKQKKHWVISVPKAKAGDWVYVNVYDGTSPRFPWGAEWFKVNKKGTVSLPLASAKLPSGTNKLSVQDRKGKLLGWTTVTVAKPKAAAKPTVNKKPTTVTKAPVKVSAPKPAKPAAQPVTEWADLDEKNAGKASVSGADGKLVVTVPEVQGGDWAYLFLYTETGKVVGIDWVQVGTDHKLNVTVGKLPDGAHKLALVSAKGQLVGWVGVDGPKPLEKPEAEAAINAEVPPLAEVDATTQLATTDAPAPVASGSNTTWTLILAGVAVLVLAGSAAGVIILQTPPRPRP